MKEELLAKIHEEDSSIALFVGARTSLADALRAVVEYASQLYETDYRGNPPAERYIAKKLYSIINENLGCDHTYVEPIYMPGFKACLKCEHVIVSSSKCDFCENEANWWIAPMGSMSYVCDTHKPDNSSWMPIEKELK